MILDTTGQGSISAPTEVVTKSKTPMRIGFAGALVAVAGLGGFAVKTALSEPAGPQSPEAAAAEFFEAMGNEDIIGMAEVWLPSEREAYIDPSMALIDELERLEIFGEGVEIDSLGTLDIVVEGIEFTSTPLAPGFATVKPTAGTVSVTGTSDDVPVMKAVKEWLDEEPEDYASTADVDEPRNQDEYVVAVEHNGSWYLSLGYTAAEISREETNKPLPAFGQGPTPVGGATPEEAIENFAAELVEVDLEGMLTQLDPEEMRVLYDYAPLFIDDGQEVIDAGLEDLREMGVSWNISDLDVRSEDRRGRTVVIVEGFTLSGSLESNTAILDFRDKCVSVKVSGPDIGEIDEGFCEGDDLEQIDQLGTVPEFFTTLENLEFDTAGITVVERYGRWYISTVPSMLYLYVDVLVALEPSDVEAMKSGFQELQDFVESGSLVDGLFADSYDSSYDDEYEEGDFVPISEAIGTGGSDDEYLEFADPDSSWIPDGYDFFSEDPDGWFINDGTIEPTSAFSVFDGDSFDLVSVAEYKDSDEAKAALQQGLTNGYLVDSEDYLTIERSGRFLIIKWTAADESSDAYDATLAQLADK